MRGLAGPDFVPETPPPDEMHDAVYLVTRLPLLDPGVKDTFSRPDAVRFAVTFVGAAGAPTITDGDFAEAGLVPIWLVALTVHV